MIDKINTPILLIIFNRPKVTREVFNHIREARPTKLYISADGPRPSKPGDARLCSETRIITENIDWPCEVHRKYSEENLGCDPHIISAVNWMFENEKSGIVLEDDCVPNRTFFSFCQEMLLKYEREQKVMHINGSNFQFGNVRGNGSYYFSKYSHSWGWATWKRAWQIFDKDMAQLPIFEKSGAINSIVKNKLEKKYWLKFFRDLYNKRYSFWDSKWIFAIWNNKGVAITPNVNLVTNIGAGKEATHTERKEKLMFQKSRDFNDIKDPTGKIEYNKDADNFTFKVYFKRNIFQKIFYKLSSFLK